MIGRPSTPAEDPATHSSQHHRHARRKARQQRPPHAHRRASASASAARECNCCDRHAPRHAAPRPRRHAHNSLSTSYKRGFSPAPRTTRIARSGCETKVNTRAGWVAGEGTRSIAVLGRTWTDSGRYFCIHRVQRPMDAPASKTSQLCGAHAHTRGRTVRALSRWSAHAAQGWSGACEPRIWAAVWALGRPEV